MLLSEVTLSSQTINVIIGVILTTTGILIVGFITFFLRRLVQQLDANTKSLETISRTLSVLEARMTTMEHNVTIVPMRETISVEKSSKGTVADAPQRDLPP